MSPVRAGPVRWQRADGVKGAAALWGFVVFMPVGLNYLGFFLVAAALLAAGGFEERAARWRRNPLAWPVAAYAAWTAVVLLVRPLYPETPAELWHGSRIALTLAMTVLLSREEAVFALRGFVAGAALALAAMLLSATVGLPDFALWHNVVVMKGNKSINDALLFAVLGAAATVAVLGTSGPARMPAWRLPAALAFTGAMALVVTAALPSRTSLIAMFAALVAAFVHQWRGRWRALALSLCLMGAAAGAFVSQAHSIEDKFRLGVSELEAAEAGAVSEGSWVVRFHMYRETTRMMLDRPWTGWGIGGWTPQWKLRAPPMLADYNMPHDDFLWMGAQAGVPGLLTLAAVFAAGLWSAWRNPSLAGRLALSAMTIMAVATALNSALRDAAIGLSLPWIVFVFVRLAQPPAPVHSVSQSVSQSDSLKK